MSILKTVLSSALLMSASVAASAADTTVQFAGAVNSVSSLPIELSTAIAGTLTYNSTSIGDSGYFSGAVKSFTLVVGEYSMDAVGGDIYLVNNESSSGADEFRVFVWALNSQLSGSTAPCVGGSSSVCQPWVLELTLRDSTGTVYSDTDTLPDFFDLVAFDSSRIYAAWIAPVSGQQGNIAGPLTAVSVVPESSTWALMLLGLAAIGSKAAARRIGRKRS